jgi:hypothetical protein
MKTRTDLLNHLAEKYDLQRYLEIGVQVPELNFDKINCPDKIGVDPDPSAKATFCKSSDEFFDMVTKYRHPDGGPISEEVEPFNRLFVSNESYMKKTISFGIEFDLIFIDGLHTAEQVKKDFENALKILSPNGFIVLHDCNPEKEEHTIAPRPTARGHWNGSCYKFAASLLHKGKRTVDIDNGCMVVPGDREYQILYEPLSIWTWDLFNNNRQRALNLISWDEFIAIGS